MELKLNQSCPWCQQAFPTVDEALKNHMMECPKRKGPIAILKEDSK